jgi:hypothetical protein
MTDIGSQERQLGVDGINDSIEIYSAMESAKGSLLVWHEKIGDDEWQRRMEYGPRQTITEWTNMFIQWSPHTKIAHIALFERPWWARGPFAKLWRYRILRRLWASSGYADSG